MLRTTRSSQSLLARWWWTIDRYSLMAIFALMALGAVLVTASSPPVAERIGLDPFYFVRHQQIFLLLALPVLIGVSLMSPLWVRRLSVFGLGASFFLMILVPFFGFETKGASRWINVMGFSIQPSEFMKPFFAVITAWIFSLRQKYIDFPAYWLSFGMYGFAVLLLLLQPDFGMVVTLTVIWSVQVFLAGLPMIWVLLLVLMAAGGGVGAYFLFHHVRQRIDRFLDPTTGDNYQVERSLEAFQNGGFLGRGPGEGQVKLSLPDSHTDFIFAVVGEEFGLIACLLIVGLFFFIVAMGLIRVWRESDSFLMIAVAGLLTQFSIQALINMGVSVQLLPAKGMTLPFLSYGGSSVMAVAMAMGMVLALTRKRFGKSL
jgi:cell division protein FtsW